MKTVPLLLAGALLSCGVAAAHDQTPKRAQTPGHDDAAESPTGDDAAESPTGDARLAPLFDNVLLFHIDGEVSIPMFLKADGSLYYVDLHLDVADLKENYTRTVSWKLQGEELCVIKAADDMPCIRLPELKPGEVTDTAWRVVDDKGKVHDQGVGKLMLLSGRPAASTLAGD